VALSKLPRWASSHPLWCVVSTPPASLFYKVEPRWVSLVPGQTNGKPKRRGKLIKVPSSSLNGDLCVAQDASNHHRVQALAQWFERQARKGSSQQMVCALFIELMCCSLMNLTVGGRNRLHL
jgi:hypothetical protein